MTVTTDALIPALEDALVTHAAVIDRFRSDVAVTPVGPHRQTLERHVADAQAHIARIDDHVRGIRPRRLLPDTAEMVMMIAENTMRTVRLPLEIGATIAGGLLRGRSRADERRLLKNAEAEYVVAARALAACRAGESIAVLAQDEEAADLLAALRRQDEQLLQKLAHGLDEQARALAAATANGSRVQADGGLTGAAAHAVRLAVDRVREGARTGGQQTRRTAADAAREMPSPTRMAEQVQGAAIREDDLPIPGYGQLTVTDITQQLRTLPQSDLTVIEGYERAHADRAGVLNAIAQLRGSQPWPDYDTMSTDQIAARLRIADPKLGRQVQDYEQRHGQRQGVMRAARQQAGGTA